MLLVFLFNSKTQFFKCKRWTIIFTLNTFKIYSHRGINMKLLGIFLYFSKYFSITMVLNFMFIKVSGTETWGAAIVLPLISHEISPYDMVRLDDWIQVELVIQSPSTQFPRMRAHPLHGITLHAPLDSPRIRVKNRQNLLCSQ